MTIVITTLVFALVALDRFGWWILAHMIEETARHCGHADLIREAVDGLVGEDPARDEIA